MEYRRDETVFQWYIPIYTLVINIVPIDTPAMDSNSAVPWASSQGSGMDMDSISIYIAGALGVY